MLRKLATASVMPAATSSIAAADDTTGTIVAYDRKAEIIVLEDKTIWTLDGSEAAVPADLEAGDRVKIDFESEGEDGITKIESIEPAPE